MSASGLPVPPAGHYGEEKKLGAVDFPSVVTSTLNSTWNLATKIFRDSVALIGTGYMGRNVSEVART